MSILLSAPALKRIVASNTSVPEYNYFTVTDEGIELAYYNGPELIVRKLSNIQDIGDLLLTHGAIDECFPVGSGVRMYKQVKYEVYTWSGSPVEICKPVEFWLSHIEVSSDQALSMAIAFETTRIIKTMGNPVREGRAKVISMNKSEAA